MATDSHGNQSDFVPAGPTHGLAYEPDKFAVKTILAVPGAVIVTGFLAFVITSLLFDNLFDPAIREPADIPAAVDRTNAPINDRLGRLSSSDPAAETNQPRLEGLVRTKDSYRDGDPKNDERSNVVSSEITPAQPTREGNSPRYRAQDLAPDHVDALRTGGPAGVPIDQAMADLVNGRLLKARTGAGPLAVNPDWDRPKESNGGRNTKAGEVAPPPPEAKKKDPEPEKKPGDGKKE